MNNSDYQLLYHGSPFTNAFFVLLVCLGKIPRNALLGGRTNTHVILLAASTFPSGQCFLMGRVLILINSNLPSFSSVDL